MRISEKIINCRELDYYKNSKRTLPFNVAIFHFDYLSNNKDKEFLDKVFSKGEILARKVNPAAANLSSYNRTSNRILNNATAGLLAEFCWKKYINYKAESEIVDYTEFTSASVQIDLMVLKNSKLIEVRSSFPRHGIEFALCNKNYEFDILGPYSNTVKPSEIQKDFYTRTLFHIPSGKSFLEIAKQDGLQVFLTGGATWEMMADDDISKNKHLLPDDLISQEQNAKSVFRVVPFSKALDTLEIFDLICK